MSVPRIDLDDMIGEEVEYDFDTHADKADELAGRPTLAQELGLAPLPDMSQAGIQVLSNVTIMRDAVVDQFGNVRQSRQALLGPRNIGAMAEGTGWAAAIGSNNVVANVTNQQLAPFVAGFQQSALDSGFDRVNVRLEAVQGQRPRMVNTDFLSRTITGYEPEQAPAAIPAASSKGTFGVGPSLQQRTTGFVTDSEETVGDVLKCGNCHRWGHSLGACIMPNKVGFVSGCACCNKMKHDTEECPNLPETEDLRDARLYQYYVVGRANLPPLAATEWNWAEKSSQMRVRNSTGWPLLRSQVARWLTTPGIDKLWEDWDYKEMKGKAVPLGIKSAAHIHNLTDLRVGDVLFVEGGTMAGKRRGNTSSTATTRAGPDVNMEEDDDDDDEMEVDEQPTGGSKKTAGKRGKRGKRWAGFKPRKTMRLGEAITPAVGETSKEKMEARRKRFGPVEARGSSSHAGHRKGAQSASRDRNLNLLTNTQVGVRNRFISGVEAKDRELSGTASTTHTDTAGAAETTGQPASSATANDDSMDFETQEDNRWNAF